MELEMISVDAVLGRHGIESGELFVCDMNTISFKYMCAQMKAVFEYTEEKGPIVTDDNFDDKCLKICEKARKENVHLLMFPEYAISFKVLEKIAEEGEYKPIRGALWCLPCQGITYGKFLDNLDELEEKGAVVIREGVDEEGGLKCPKNFVNALFYCFMGMQNGKLRLIFLPQLKLCHMRDVDNLCEASGMTMGKWIYYFGKPGRTNVVCSLICADVFHSEMSWEFIRSNLYDKIIILHPQLNHNPKQEDFRRVRSEMMGGSNKALYITCNWASGTQLIGEQKSSIYMSWSGIYYKHSEEDRFSDWISHIKKLTEKNDEICLFGGYLPKKKTELWYSGEEEMVQVIDVRKPGTFAMGALVGGKYVQGKTRYICEEGQIVERTIQFSFKDYLRPMEKEYLEYVERIEKQELYAFPIKCASRHEAEGFLDMLMAKEDYTCYRLESNEESHSHFTKVNPDRVDYVQEGLSQYITLVSMLKKKGMPEHLKGKYGGKAYFTYTNEERDAFNFRDEEKGNTVLLARADSKREAERFVDFIRRKIYGNQREISDLPFKVCVFFKKIDQSQEDYYPKVINKITVPDRMENIQSIYRD